jgi:copper chaperone NosL
MHRLSLVFAFCLVVTAAWAQAPGPVDTDFKSDSCAQCHMAVTSTSYAAQIVVGGKALFFDDIGCLVQYERKAKVDPKAGRYVRTADGAAWVSVDLAVWVLNKDVRTPMGYGFHASAPGTRVSQPLTWKDVQAAVPAKMGAM